MKKYWEGEKRGKMQKTYAMAGNELCLFTTVICIACLSFCLIQNIPQLYE